MNVETNALIPAILSYLSENTANVSKTKLLKLLYLFDVEFYRQHGKTFTGFDWKFFHLGPWTAEFDDVLRSLIDRRVLVEVPFSAKEYDGTTLRVEEPHSLRSVVENVADESILIRILIDWGSQPTGKLLDHVYFRTEPMEFGIRNDRLDFSVIQLQRPGQYRRSSSSAGPGLIAKRKREFQKRLDERRRNDASYGELRVKTPRYDEEYANAMNTLERLSTS